MKRTMKRLLCLFAVLTLCMPWISAKAGMDAAVITCDEVDTVSVFRAVYEKEQDFEIRGSRAVLYFYYENIYRSTEKWRPFSTEVSVTAEVPAALRDVLGGLPAYFVDFRDGDRYPGPAEITVQMADILGAARGPFLIYAYDETEEGVPVLEPIAERLMLGEDGAFRVTADQAADYLLIAAETAPAGLRTYLRTVTVGKTGFFSGAAIGWIVFFVLVGLALVGLVLYLVTVRILRYRKAQKKALPAASGKRKSSR